MISKITSRQKPRTITLREIRILIGQFKFIAYSYKLFLSSFAAQSRRAQSENLPHNGVNVKEAQFSYKRLSLQNCYEISMAEGDVVY